MQADTEHKLGSWLIEAFANSPLGISAEQGAISLQYASASTDANGADPPTCISCMPAIAHRHQFIWLSLHVPWNACTRRKLRASTHVLRWTMTQEYKQYIYILCQLAVVYVQSQHHLRADSTGDAAG